MRIGLITRADLPCLDQAKRLGFKAFEWVRFETSGAGIGHTQWQGFANDLAAAAQLRGLGISAIVAFYRNPLDPPQTETARATIRRAIEVAAFLRIKTVSAFAGGVIEMATNPRGGNPIYQPLENFLPQVLAFWEPLAEFAADHGVRIAFENCPQGPFHLPLMGYNLMARPAMWERFFSATRCPNLGLEWDPSHLVCQLIDPVANLRKFGSRVFHVHVKDAYINRPLLETYGICHPGVAEHRVAGFGQVDWGQIIHLLTRIGYDSELTVEGWHDPVFRNHAASDAAPGTSEPDPLAGQLLEETGLALARQTLERFLIKS